MLRYLQGTTRLDITMATHQCAIFNNDPHLSYEQSVKRVGRYLLDTREKGMFYRLEITRGLEYYVGADFSGG